MTDVQTTAEPMREYALAKVTTLFDAFAKNLHKAADTADEDAVHKMRVSIRRLQQAIRLFAQYLDTDGVETVKADLRSIMQAAGELRNRDIAIALLSEMGADISHFEQEREEWNHRLVSVLRGYTEGNAPAGWRHSLGLEHA